LDGELFKRKIYIPKIFIICFGRAVAQLGRASEPAPQNKWAGGEAVGVYSLSRRQSAYRAYRNRSVAGGL